MDNIHASIDPEPSTNLPSSWIVATFYKFISLPDFQLWQDPLRNYCLQHQIKGTILLAAEGINGTIVGSREAIDAVFIYLQEKPELADLSHRESIATFIPFERFKVKLKREIVTLGLPEVNPQDQVGQYVEPQDWNTLIQDPAVTVIDTRNQYEVSIGTFQGAINPQTRSFRDFPGYVQQQLSPQENPKVALFCTGGIRCEKATALMLQLGFSEVYHLKGGILNYLQSIPPEQSLWQGECFVFDDRVALQEGLKKGHYELCRACGHPLSTKDKEHPAYQPNQSCPFCHDQNAETFSTEGDSISNHCTCLTD